LSERRGLFHLGPNGSSRLGGTAEQLLRDSQNTGITRIADDVYSVSSSAGVLFIDQHGDLIDSIRVTDGEGIQAPIVKVFADQHGTLWIPVFGPGIIAMADQNRSIRCIDLLEGRMRWMTTFAGRRYASLDRGMYEFRPIASSLADGVTAEQGLAHALRRYQPVRVENTLGPHNGYAIASNEMLVATSKGAIVFGNDGEIKQTQVGGRFLNGAAAIREDCVLFGTSQGIQVLRRSPNDGKWRVDRMMFPHLQGTWQIIHQPGDRWVWFTMRNKQSLNIPARFPLDLIDNESNDAAQQIETYAPASDHPHSRFAFWNDSIVYSCNDGLNLYDHARNRFVPIANFFPDLPDEMTQRMGPVLRGPRSCLWTCTNDGTLLRLSPEGRVDSPFSLSSQERIRLFFRDDDHVGMLSNKNRMYFAPSDLQPAGAVRNLRFFSYNTDSDGIERSLPEKGIYVRVGDLPLKLTYTCASQNRFVGKPYQWRLVGQSNAWSRWTPQGLQTFRDLSPGQYTFQVRSRSRGLVPTPPISVSITIAPPWYRTSTAWACYGLAIFLGGAGLMGLRSIVNHQRMRALRSMVDERTAELVEARKDLEEKVIERSRQLREKDQQLLHTERLSTLGEMVAGVIHEIRQPLTSISNYSFAATRSLQPMTQEPELRQVHAWNKTIVQLVQRVDAISKRLLQFARRQTSRREAQAIDPIVVAAIDLMRLQVKGQEIEMRYLPDPTLPIVYVEKIQVEQVLVNLISNAAAAMKDQGGKNEITVSVWKADDCVWVSVRDTGPGVPPEKLRGIFEAFETSRESGLGLGLSICRSIVQAHGGNIAAENLADGFEVRFSLPTGPNLPFSAVSGDPGVPLGVQESPAIPKDSGAASLR
ncbi:MAG: ATP-binding protein, partial [Planctomycetota bacterium]